MSRHQREAIKVMRFNLKEAQNLRTGRSWPAVEAAHRSMSEAKKAMAGLWRDAQARSVWDELLPQFREAIDEVHPADFWSNFHLLRNGDAAGLESGIEFLEADPWFFRSGYIKEWIIQAVKKMDLSEEFKERLRNVIGSVVQKQDHRREVLFYCRLARKVYNTEFIGKLQLLKAHPDHSTSRRARAVLLAVEQEQKMKHELPSHRN